MTIGNNFYNLNSTRGYPLDDLATGISEAGEHLPDGLIVDICLRFPDTLGHFAFLSAVHVSDRIVSVAISAADSLSDNTLRPIATVALAQPVAEGRPYQLVSGLAGVGGWIVFGKLDTVRFAGAFSTAQQGLLLSQPARSYHNFPISWASKILDESKLQGVVKLIAGRDLEIVRDKRTILGESRDAIVFRLTGDPNVVLPRYVGPCGVRPESNNCLKPSIEAINEVVPDDDGNIQIAFPDLSVLNLPHGLLLSTALSLPAICPTPIVDGNPDENFCESFISDDSVSHSLPSGGGGDGGGDGGGGISSEPGSSSDVLTPGYPKCVRFYSNLTPPFTTQAGSWLMQNFDEFNYVRCAAYPDEFSTQRRMYTSPLNYSIQQNIATFNDPEYLQNVNINLQTVVRTNTLEDANMGLVLDYRRIGGLDNFTAVYFDFKRKQLAIQRMAAGIWLTPVAAMTGLLLVRNHWYNLDVRIKSSTTPGRVDITASYNDLTSPPPGGGANVVQVLSMPGYGFNNGGYGFFSMACLTYFTHLYINEL